MDNRTKWVEDSWTRSLAPPFPTEKIKADGYELREEMDKVGRYWKIVKKTLDGK